jgi:hypothetical protein
MVEIAKKLMESLDAYGPSVVVIAVLILVNGFFIWRDWKREDRQQKAIDSLYKDNRDVVLPLLVECRDVIASCKQVIVQNSEVIMRLIGGVSK